MTRSRKEKKPQLLLTISFKNLYPKATAKDITVKADANPNRLERRRFFSLKLSDQIFATLVYISVMVQQNHLDSRRRRMREENEQRTEPEKEQQRESEDEQQIQPGKGQPMKPGKAEGA